MPSHQALERRRSLITGLLAVAIFICAHPIVIEHYSTRFLGGAAGDGGLYVWLVQSFINNPKNALTFETNALYPYPITRAWSDVFFLPSFVALLFTYVGLSFPAAYNSVALLALSSNAVACGILARHIGLSPAFALAVGVLFANSSYMVGNLGHPQLMFFFWIPLAWWAVLPRSSNERAPSRRWFIAGICVAGAFYSAVYYSVCACIGLAIIWLRGLLYGRFSLRRALRTVLFAALGAAPIAYSLPAYLAVQRQFGSRGLHEAAQFAATGLSYLSFTPLHDIFGRTAALSHSEAYLSAGYIISILALASTTWACWIRSRILTVALVVAFCTLLVASSIIDQGSRSEEITCVSAWVLALAVLAFTLRDRSAFGYCAIIATLFFLFSFGPGGNPHKGEPSFTPLGLLFYKVPGLAAVRAVGRYGSVVIYAVLIAAAFGIQRYISLDRLRKVDIPPAAAAMVLLIFGLVDNLVTTIPFDTPIPAPQAFSVLAADKSASGATLILPFSNQPDDNNSHLKWSQIAITNSRYALWESNSHSTKLQLVNGYSGQRSKVQMQLPRAMQNFPDASSCEYLARLCGVRYIIIVPSLYENWNEALFTERLSNQAAAFSAVQRFEDGSILISLAGYGVTARGGVLAPFFAPRDTPIRLMITPSGPEACSVKATSLGKAANGARIALQTSEYSVKHEQTLALAPPYALSNASPHIVELQIDGCTAKVRCETSAEK